MRALVVPTSAILFVLLATVSLLLWIASLRIRIGIIPLGADTSMCVTEGIVEVRRIYARNVAPEIPDTQWFNTAVGRGWINPPPAQGFPRFAFFDGRVLGEAQSDGYIAPASYWLCASRSGCP
jgi:hypothetical protein